MSTTRETKPRLLIVAPSAELYGSDRSLLQLLPFLVVEFDVVMASPMDGPLVGLGRECGAHVQVLPDYAIRQRHLRPFTVIPWLVRIVRAARVLHRLHRSREFSLVYSGTLAAGLGSLMKLVWRVPHVQHIREFPHHGRLTRTVLLRWVALTADRAVCNSRYIRDACVSTVPVLARRITVVHNGVDVPASVPEPVESVGPLRVVCAGRISPAKGQSVLIDAAEIAADNGSDWELHFYGDSLPEDRDVERRLRERVVEAGLSERTTFHGFVPDQDEVYGDADVVIVPSVIPEPFGRTVIEAQIRGIPVVASTPGGPSEVIIDGETGCLFQIGDADGLAAAIRILEDPSVRRPMGEAGRARTTESFTTARYVRRVTGILVAAVGERQTGRRTTVTAQPCP